jgi:hypothetical protein
MKRIHSRSAKPIIVIVVLVGTIVFLSQMSLRESYDVESGVKLRVKPSPIQGTGVFADETVKQGAVIIGANGVTISKLGKLVNHCAESYNALVRKDGSVYNLVSTKKINKGDEITANYDIVNSKYPFIAGSNPDYKKC